jgi:hypothetical protein
MSSSRVTHKRGRPKSKGEETMTLAARGALVLFGLLVACPVPLSQAAEPTGGRGPDVRSFATAGAIIDKAKAAVNQEKTANGQKQKPTL